MTWWVWGNKHYYKQANGVVGIVAERPRSRVPTKSPGIRNAIFCVLESMATQYLSTYGGEHPVTPVLEKMKSRSRSFTSAYAHAPTTNKSIVSLFCSVYPWVSTHSMTKKYPENILPALPPRTSDGIKRKLAAWVQYQARLMQNRILTQTGIPWGK